MSRRHSAQAGFSYIDVMIAVTILLVGLLTFSAALTGAVVTTGESEQRMRAKQLATSILETVLAAPTMKIAGVPYSFDSIDAVGVGTGQFLTTRQDIYVTPGPDGLYGTQDDDDAAGPKVDGFQMQITITNIGTNNPPVEKRIDVTIFYTTKGVERTETISTITTRY